MDDNATGSHAADIEGVGAPAITPEDAIDALERIYEHRKQQNDFKDERAAYVDLIPLLIKKLSPNYVLNAPIDLGSTATVWGVTDKMLNIRRALKIARPRFGRLADIIVVLRGEPQKLAGLNHNSIIKVYGTDEIPFEIRGDKYHFPYFLMDFFDDVDDVDDYILRMA
jgi:hypothetical protein